MEYVSVALDVGLNMGDRRCADPTQLDKAASHLDLGVGVLVQLITKKMLFSNKHMVGLVKFGTRETNNDLFDEEATDDSSYSNIDVSQNPCAPDVDFLKRSRRIGGGGSTADCLDAVIVAADQLYKATETGVRSKAGVKRVILLTNGRVPADMENADQIEHIKSSFQKSGFHLSVLGTGFDEHSDIYPDEPLASISVPPGSKKTESQWLLERTLTKLAHDTGGTMVPINNQFDTIVTGTKEVKSVTKYRGELEISSLCKIPVWIFASVAEQKFPSLTKVALPKDGDDLMDNEGGDDAAAGEGGAFAKVGQDRTYTSLTDDDKMLKPEDMVKGHKYGRDRVPFAKVDEAVLKFEAEKCFQILYFTPREKVPRHLFTGETDVISAPCKSNTDKGEKESRATVALNALAQGLHNTGNVAIARLVKRARSTPAMTVIFANPVDTEFQNSDPSGACTDNPTCAQSFCR